MNPHLPLFLFFLILTTAVLIALFSRGPLATGSDEVMCPIPEPQGSAD